MEKHRDPLQFGPSRANSAPTGFRGKTSDGLSKTRIYSLFLHISQGSVVRVGKRVFVIRIPLVLVDVYLPLRLSTLI